jgi:voltage-gated potassium channel
MTTGGCGDHYPVTAAGRLVAFGLMLGGIALLGTVTAASTIQDARVEQALSIMIKIQAESADALVAILDDHDEMIRMGANAAMHAST